MENNNQKKEIFSIKYLAPLFWVSVFVGLAILFIFIYVIARYSSVAWDGKFVDGDLTGQVGDFIGGTVGTLWLLSSIIIIYKTYVIQKQANSNLEKQGQQLQLENIYFRFIDDFQKIEFKDADKPRVFQFSVVANDLHARGNSNNLLELREYFSSRQSRASLKLSKLLTFIIKYLKKKKSEGFYVDNLLSHLEITMVIDEKIILFYYLCAFPNEIKEYREWYIKSDFVPVEHINLTCFEV